MEMYRDPRPDAVFWHVCPNCRGEGRIEHLTGYDPHDGSQTGWTEECDWCNGTGEVEDEMQDDGRAKLNPGGST